MKLLLAGPGTGKTTKIKSIIRDEFPNAERIRVLSFTQATVKDLTSSFSDNQNVFCSTLHGFALGLNHTPTKYILSDTRETQAIEKIAKRLDITFADACEQLNCITFDGMIAECVSFLRSNPVYAKDKVGSLDLLIVDEFQDFNPDEQALIMLISKLSTETIILGDDDQSIYGFKDADPDGIISLYHDNQIEKLQHENICYRCPDDIIDYCSRLLEKNKNRVKKVWKKNGKAGNVIVQQKLNQEQCDGFILDKIEEIRKTNDNAGILILSPVGFAVKSLREKLATAKTEVVDCWAETISSEILEKIWWLNAIFSNHKILSLIFIVSKSNLTDYRKNKLLKLFTSFIQKGQDETEVLQQLLDFGYLNTSLLNCVLNEPDATIFFDQNTGFSILLEYIDLEDINVSVTRLTEKVRLTQEFDNDKINMMSIHKSKGLQADFVLITGLVQGILPNDTKGLDTIESQRRLLFVGMSRALKDLYLISTVEWSGQEVNKVDKSQFEYFYRTKGYRGRTSKFVDEMQKEI
jgi:DNA helicase II / ATP-dependent DNA helicase PcrA